MATMLVTAIAAPQPTYSTSSTCQLIIRTRIPSHQCSPLLLCGFCPCVGYVGVVCVAYKNTSRPFRAADPAHVQEVLFAVEKDPCCYRVESCRVESSYMCGGKAALVFLFFLVMNRTISVRVLANIIHNDSMNNFRSNCTFMYLLKYVTCVWIYREIDSEIETVCCR